MLAQRDQQDLAGVKDRAQAHRDGLRGHVLLAKEIAGRVAPRDRVERAHPGAAIGQAKRFVEADVPVAADAQQLNVDAAGLANLLLVPAAMLLQLVRRSQPVGNENVLVFDVDPLEQVLVHPAAITLQPLAAQAQVFVEIEGHDAREIEPFVLVHPRQLAIDAHRRAARRQPEHRLLPLRLPLANHPRDQPGHVSGQVLVRIKNVARQGSSRQRAQRRLIDHRRVTGGSIRVQ